MFDQEQTTTLEKKIERFQAILEEIPGDRLTVLALAEASFRRGLKLEALTNYQTVILKQAVPEAHFAVAEIYSQQDMITEAYGELRRLFELDPENVEAILLARNLATKAPPPDDITEILNRPISDEAFAEATLRLQLQRTIHNRELQERTRNVTLEPGVVIHEYYVEEAKKKLLEVDDHLRRLEELRAENALLESLPRPETLSAEEDEDEFEEAAGDLEPSDEEMASVVTVESSETDLQESSENEGQILAPSGEIEALDIPIPSSETEGDVGEEAGDDGQLGDLAELPILPDPESGEEEPAESDEDEFEFPSTEPFAEAGEEELDTFIPPSLEELPVALESGEIPPSEESYGVDFSLEVESPLAPDLPDASAAMSASLETELASDESGEETETPDTEEPPVVVSLDYEPPVELEDLPTMSSFEDSQEVELSLDDQSAEGDAESADPEPEFAVMPELPSIPEVVDEPVAEIEPEAEPAAEVEAESEAEPETPSELSDPLIPSASDPQMLAAERQVYYESKAEELGKLTGALSRTRGVTSIFLVARDGMTVDSVVGDTITEERMGELVRESFDFLLAYADSPEYWVLECGGGIFVMQTVDDFHVLVAIGQAGANFGALRYTMDKAKIKFQGLLAEVPR